MRVITQSRVKELLGIGSDDTYDADINTAIPIVDAAVKRIMRNRLNWQIIGETTNGSKYMEVYQVMDNWHEVYNRKWLNEYLIDLQEYLEVGQRVNGEGIADDTYIEEVYYNGPTVEFSGTTYNVPVVEMSNAATATNTNAQVFLGINIGLEPIIAKAVFWQVGQLNTSIRDESWVSKSMGPVSVTKSTLDAKIDGKSGMPLFLIKALPNYHGGH